MQSFLMLASKVIGLVVWCSFVLHCGWLPAVTTEVKETKPAKNSGQVAAGKKFLKMLPKSG